jgi:eukaryotic-like serine/threonine-protein kinase
MDSGATRVEGQAVKYYFGEFELIPNQGALWRAGIRVSLTPKPLAALLVLIEHAGRTVSKDDLLRQVWPGTAVEENNLTQSISTLRKVLGEKRGENRYIITEPGNGYRFVATVTRIEEAPVLDLIPEAPALAPAHRQPSYPVWLAVPIVLVLLAVATFYISRSRNSPRSPAIPLRPSIAVLGFRDLVPQKETSWISAAVSELMNVDLGGEQRLRVLPLDNVARMRIDLGLSPQPTYSAALLQRIRRNLGSDYLVTGSYSSRATGIHLDVTLIDLHSGRTLSTVGDDSTGDRLPQLTERCAQRIRAQLGVRLASAGNPSFEASAMEPYARGMEFLRQGDALNARPYLEKAVQAEPSNPLIHSGLAAAWSALGLDIRSAQEAKLAFDSGAAFGRVEQLEIEGRYRSIVHNWPRAIEVYQALFTLLPDDLEYGLLLASAETYGGKAQDALATVTALRALPSPLADDPRVDMAEARAAGALSDFARTRKAAGRSAEKARAQGARLQYARARLLEAGAMQNLVAAGFAEVRAEARGICAELGDRACVAAAYRMEANQMTMTGSLATARRAYQSALEISTQMGNSLEQLNGLIGLAYAARLEGDLRAAERYLEAALPVGSQMGPVKRYPVCLNLAQVLAEEGDIAKAKPLIEEALQISRQIGDQEGVALSQASQGQLLFLEGKDTEALDRYKEALAILRQVNEPVEVAGMLLEFGYVQLDEGDLAAARKSLEESRSLPNGLPAGAVTPQTDLAFAHLSFAEGHFADAASHARAALRELATSGRKGEQLEAAAVLTRALIAQGSGAEASQVLAQLPQPEAAKLPVESIFHFQIARCFLLANTGRGAEALEAVDVLSANATRMGIRSLEKEVLQARKALVRTAPESSKVRPPSSGV